IRGGASSLRRSSLTLTSSSPQWWCFPGKLARAVQHAAAFSNHMTHSWLPAGRQPPQSRRETDPLIILHIDKRANVCQQVNTGPVLLMSIL
ncbi:MAG TPA: hypothetical protein VN039_14320, partial [Nitrospira sp.]|nr:hypothetical protein [Nitrospira sp.]